MMVVTADLLPGMFFLHHGQSWVSRSVSSAQAFVRGGSFWTHAGLYLGNGKIIEAQPGGARICDFSPEYDHAMVLWSDAPIQRELAAHPGDPWGIEEELRAAVVAAASKLENTPYSFLDYLSVAAVEWKWPGWEKLRGYVQSSGHLICSALVDRAYMNAGVHLFDDRRLPGDVTPGDLDRFDQHWVRSRLGDLESRLRRIETHLGLDTRTAP
jgi:cell wall-associated NlpC family hydrolase